MNEIKKMNLKEFKDLGYLQEVNRLFFHPRGLALSLIEKDNGQLIFDGIFDAREDPEGWIFETIDEQKVKTVEKEFKKHLQARNKMLKTKKGIQPIDDSKIKSESA